MILFILLCPWCQAHVNHIADIGKMKWKRKGEREGRRKAARREGGREKGWKKGQKRKGISSAVYDY